MQQENDDYLTGFTNENKNLLKNLSMMGDKLKQLKLEMLEAQEVAEQKKKAYEHYANVIVPQEMYAAGVDKVGLSSGGTLQLKHNFYCQPNKNAEDRKKIVEWLRANGGDYIVEHDASVAAQDMNKLKQNGIAYIENTSVNTAKLKSFIKDKIGVTTGVQQIEIDDIPACIHFQEVTVVEIEA